MRRRGRYSGNGGKKRESVGERETRGGRKERERMRGEGEGE